MKGEFHLADERRIPTKLRYWLAKTWESPKAVNSRCKGFLDPFPRIVTLHFRMLKFPSLHFPHHPAVHNIKSSTFDGQTEPGSN